MTAERRSDWDRLLAELTPYGERGHFVSITLASADDAFDPSGSIPPTPLWRGHAVLPRIEGMETLFERPRSFFSFLGLRRR